MVCAFHERGNSYKRLYSTGRRPFDLPEEVEKYIRESLEENAFISLRKRCELIKEHFGFPIDHKRLIRVYKRFGIKYKRLKTVMKASL